MPPGLVPVSAPMLVPPQALVEGDGTVPSARETDQSL
jgi:hypothetical protein